MLTTMNPSNDIHLYVIMSPNYALVASQLEPHDFGRHYTTGSSRFYNGTVIFAEIDNTYRHEFFAIDELLKEVKPAPDGTPKRTKFIATYRVLEHIDLSAFKNLYVTSVEGEVLSLERAPYERQHESGYIRTFQEICPFSAVVLSNFTGYLLPWDQLAYWAITISTSMLDYIPGVGTALKEWILGGPEPGPKTLINFYAIHTAILPILLLFFLPFHFWRIRKAGGLIIPRSPEEDPSIKGDMFDYMPHLIMREV